MVARTAEAARPQVRPAHRRPRVTLALVVVIVAAAAPSRPGRPAAALALIRAGALFRPAVDAGEWWRVFTAMFLHGDWVHLGFNMYALFMLGRFCEDVLGPLRFFVVYVAGGLAGGVASTLTRSSRASRSAPRAPSWGCSARSSSCSSSVAARGPRRGDARSCGTWCCSAPPDLHRLPAADGRQRRTHRRHPRRRRRRAARRARRPPRPLAAARCSFTVALALPRARLRLGRRRGRAHAARGHHAELPQKRTGRRIDCACPTTGSTTPTTTSSTTPTSARSGPSCRVEGRADAAMRTLAHILDRIAKSAASP